MSSRGEAERLFGRLPSTASPSGEMFFEGPIDPQEYVVGPGDKLRVLYWRPTYSEFLGVVNAEGDFALPYVGVRHLADLTLAEAKTRIEEAVAKAMRSAEVTVSLAEPRRFRVHVVGQVELPGTYVLPATARVADAIVAAGDLKRELQHVDSTWVQAAAPRRIEIRDRHGDPVGRADLLLFRRGGSLKANPMLRDGQTIHVPAATADAARVGAFGAVHQGGLFDYVPGDCVGDLLMLAGGLTPRVDSSSLELVSVNGDRTVLDLRSSPGSALLSQLLNAGDRLHAKQRRDSVRTGTVTLLGEVGIPGAYSIQPGVTTLGEVLQQAGGLIPSAAANSVRLSRWSEHDSFTTERNRLMRAYFSRNTMGYLTDTGLIQDLSRWVFGAVVLDLRPTSEEGEGSLSVKLEDGDVLEVPRSPLGVRVLGAVNNAGEVVWEPEKGLDFYLMRAGGVNRSGWKGRALVMKARNGAFLRYDPSLPIDPGDLVFVPGRPELTSWERFKDILGVTAQVATVVLIVQSVSK